jgi:hypothetical protein
MMAEKGMGVTRRSLLQMSWRAAAFAGAASAWRSFGIWKRPKASLRNVTAESFEPYEGQQFLFARPPAAPAVFSKTVELKLAKVSPHEHITRIESRDAATRGKRTRESFSLLFEMKGGEPLGEGLHRLVHRDFEECEILLSQVSRPRPDGTLLYEAVFG